MIGAAEIESRAGRNCHAEIAGRERDVLAALGIAWTPGRRHIRCPFPDHEDKKPSWRWVDDEARWFCTCDAVMRMRGCDFREAVNFALGNHPEIPERERRSRRERIAVIRNKAPIMHVIANGPPKRSELSHSTHGITSRTWAYTASDGSGIYAIIARYEAEDGKQVLPWFFDGKRWINRRAPNPWPLFRVTSFTAEPDAPVLFVEGEKTAVDAEKLFDDYVTTTSSGGAQQHKGSDYSPLKGRHVTIWPDNDDSGRAYAQAVAQHAHDAGASSIRIVDGPGNGETARARHGISPTNRHPTASIFER